eukprot:scaffold184_cov125-Cylindrotheca_fusiformis.AAC.14
MSLLDDLLPIQICFEQKDIDTTSLVEDLLPTEICFPVMQTESRGDRKQRRGRSRTRANPRNRACSNASICNSSYTAAAASVSSIEEESVAVPFSKEEQEKHFLLALGAENQSNTEESGSLGNNTRSRFDSEELAKELLLREILDDASFHSDDEQEEEEAKQQEKRDPEKDDYDLWTYFDCNADQTHEAQIWFNATCTKLHTAYYDVIRGDNESVAETLDETLDVTDEESTIETDMGSLKSEEEESLGTIEDTASVNTNNTSARESVADEDTLVQEITRMVRKQREMSVTRSPQENAVMEAIEEIQQRIEPRGIVLSDYNGKHDAWKQADPKGAKSTHTGDIDSAVKDYFMDSNFMEPDGTRMSFSNQTSDFQEDDTRSGAIDGLSAIYLENLPRHIGHDQGSVASSNWSQWAVQEDDEVLEMTFWEPFVEPVGMKLTEATAYDNLLSEATSELKSNADLLQHLDSLQCMNEAELFKEIEASSDRLTSLLEQENALGSARKDVATNGAKAT